MLDGYGRQIHENTKIILLEPYMFSGPISNGIPFDSDLAERWNLVRGYHPDAIDIAERLQTFSPNLVLLYIDELLRTNQVHLRKELAQSYENRFFTRYFGTNPEIVDFARSLFLGGKWDAAKELNRVLATVGDNVDVGQLRRNICSQFNWGHSL